MTAFALLTLYFSARLVFVVRREGLVSAASARAAIALAAYHAAPVSQRGHDQWLWVTYERAEARLARLKTASVWLWTP